LLIFVPVSGSLESSDFVVDSFHGTARDRIVIPIENSRSVALQCIGHSLKDANTGCSRASAPMTKEDGGRCPGFLSPDLSEVFLEVVTVVSSSQSRWSEISSPCRCRSRRRLTTSRAKARV
jgi:hypothetical protein